MLAKLKSPDDDEETQERDLEDYAALQSQLYVVSLLAKELDEGITFIDNSIDALSKVYGSKSRKLSSKFYQKANSLQLMGKFGDAAVAIQQAIDIHLNPEERKPDFVASMVNTQSAEHKQ